MIYLFSLFIFLNTFLPKIGFQVKFLPFHLNIVDILFALLLICSLPRILQKKMFPKFLLLYGFFLWGIISAIQGYFLSAPRNRIIDEFLRQYIYILAVPIIFAFVKDEKDKDKLLSFFFVAVGLLAIFGLLQSIFGIKFVEYSKNILFKLGYPKNASFFPPPGGEHEGRITTTLLCFNASGQYLASASILLLAKVFLDKKISIPWRCIYFSISMLCLIAVILTRSRSAWVGFFITSVLFGIIVFRKKFWAVPIGFVLIFSFFMLFNPQIIKRIKSFTNLKQDGAAWGRVEAVKASLPVIRKSPLIGYGLGMYTAQKIPADYAMYAALDCFYAKYTVSNGIIGLLIFLGVIFGLFRKVLIQISLSNINQNWLLPGAVCGLTVLLVGALFDSMLMVSTYIATLFWFYFGLLLREIDENR